MKALLWHGDQRLSSDADPVAIAELLGASEFDVPVDLTVDASKTVLVR